MAKTQIPREVLNKTLNKAMKKIMQDIKKTAKAMKPKTKVAIYVSGGAVQSIVGNKDDIEVILFDVDNMKADGISGKTIDKKWDEVQKECHHSL